MLQIVIPMAGKAARFQERGHTFPKPLLEIGNRSMIELVLENLAPPAAGEVHLHLPQGAFVAILPGRHAAPARAGMQGHRAGERNRRSAVLGAAGGGPTGSGGRGADRERRPVHQHQPRPFYHLCREPGVDGGILTFTATHPRWSFAKTDEHGNVTAVAEKRPISKQATAGLFYFRRARELVEASERMILKGLTTSGQFFVCPVYNELILAGKKVRTHHLPDGTMHSLGTPEDVEVFIKYHLDRRNTD